MMPSRLVRVERDDVLMMQSQQLLRRASALASRDGQRIASGPCRKIGQWPRTGASRTLLGFESDDECRPAVQ